MRGMGAGINSSALIPKKRLQRISQSAEWLFPRKSFYLIGMQLQSAPDDFDEFAHADIICFREKRK